MRGVSKAQVGEYDLMSREEDPAVKYASIKIGITENR